MNVAVTKGGIPKFNDFNVAHFFKWNVSSHRRCDFRGRLHEPWWRSPEEMVQSSQQVTMEHGGTIKNINLLDGKSVSVPFVLPLSQRYT
jgi:hypothetical protein